MRAGFLIGLISLVGLCSAKPFEWSLIPRVNIKHRESDGVGYSGGYTSLEGMFGFQVGDNHLPFVDVRWHVMDRGKMAVNVGGGYRYDVAGSGVLIGGSAYYDQRGTPGQSFEQVSGGVEVLSRYVDFRANGYFPIGTTKEVRDAKFANFVGHSMLLRTRNRLALTGTDAEVGAYLGEISWAKFYGALGGYFFKRQECNTHFGFKSRLRASWRDNVWAEVSLTNDDLFHTNVQGTVNVSLPFWPASPRRKLKPLSGWNYFPYRQAMLAQPVERQELIALCDTIRFVPANSSEGQQLVFVFVDNTSGSDGTIEDPYPRLREAESMSAAGDIICVFPGDGTDMGCDEGIVLQPGQRLIGSGTDHVVQTSIGPIKIPASTSTRPKISNGAGPCIKLADDVIVSGFDIESPHGYGILGVDVKGALIEDVAIYGAEDHALVLFTDKSNETLTTVIKSCSFSDNTGYGICAYATNEALIDVHLDGCTFDRNTLASAVFLGDTRSSLSGSLTDCSGMDNAEGIDLHGSSTSFNFIVDNCVSSGNFSGTGLHVAAGDYVEGDVAIKGSTFSNNADDGIEIIADNKSKFSATVDKCIVMNNLGDGIDMESLHQSDFNVNICNCTLECNLAHGLDIIAETESILNLTIKNNSISFDGINGIEFDGQGNSVCTGLICNNTMIGALSHGLRIETQDDAVFDVSITDNLIKGVGKQGVDLLAENISQFSGAFSGNIIDAPTERGIMINVSDSANMSLTIEKTTINGPTFDGIDFFIEDLGSVDVQFLDNTITNCGGNGIDFESEDNSNVTFIVKNNVIDALTDGVNFFVEHASVVNATIENNQISNAAQYGIDIENEDVSNLTMSVTNNTVDTVGQHCIELRTENSAGINATFENNTLKGAQQTGIDVDLLANAVADITMAKNTITGCGYAGVDIYGSGSNVTATLALQDNTIEENFMGAMIRGFGQRTYDMTITGNSLSDNERWGLYMYAATNSAYTSVVTNNTFNGHTYYGMLNYIGGLSTHVSTIQGNEFSQNGYYGMYLYNFNRTAGNSISITDNAFDHNGFYGIYAFHNQTPDTTMTFSDNQAVGNVRTGVFIRAWSNATLNLQMLDNTSSTGYNLNRYNTATFNIESPEPPSKESVEAVNEGTPFTTSSGINYVSLVQKK